MKPYQISLVLAVLVVTSTSSTAVAEAKNMANASGKEMIDMVIASVNGEPITLSDMSKRLKISTPLSASTIASDKNLSLALDQLILEKLVQEEAKTRNVKVPEEDIDRYLQEIALQNKLSSDDFIKALEKEGGNIKEYKEQIRLEILRSRIAAVVVRSGVSVSESEVKEYLDSHSEITTGGTKYRLQQLMVGKDHENGSKIISEAGRQLQSGAEFDAIASKLSTPTSGGSDLGIVAQEDLSQQVLRAIEDLDEESISEVIETDAGYYIYRVVAKFDPSSEGKLNNQVRRVLEKEKSQSRLETFFRNDLLQNHAVEKLL